MCFKYIGQDEYGNRWWQDPTGQIMGASQLMRGSETPSLVLVCNEDNKVRRF